MIEPSISCWGLNELIRIQKTGKTAITHAKIRLPCRSSDMYHLRLPPRPALRAGEADAADERAADRARCALLAGAHDQVSSPLFATSQR